MLGRNVTHMPFWISAGAAVYATAAATLSLLGWLANIPRLTDWLGSGITIKANAALAGAACGIALLIVNFRPQARALPRALSVAVALVGGLTLFEHVTQINLGIDTLLATEAPGAAATAAPGRMGPPASLSYVLLGLALFAHTSASSTPQRLAVTLALFVIAISMLSLVGFWYGAREMYTVPRLTGIAFQTATMLSALGVAIVTARADRQPAQILLEDSDAGALARRLLPLALVIPLVLGWLRLQGQRYQLYDAAFGTALRSVAECALLVGLLWWSINAIRRREHHRARAVEQSKESEQRLLATLDSITDGFVTIDRNWRFTFVNREAEKLLGIPRASLIGRFVWETFASPDDLRLRSELERAVRDGVVVEVEGGTLGRSGGEFAHRAYPGADGGLSIYFQNVTARKRAEALLREADRRKDEFLATLAHELRNPLAPIRNSARVFLHPSASHGARRQSAEIIDRQVQHVSRLLDDLLDVTRITRNRLELRKEWIELGQVIADAVEACKPAIDVLGQELRVDLPPNPLYLDGDPVRLTQVLSNLLNNASKYTPAGGRIEITVSSDARELLITVQDNGIGIAPELLPQIFEMFVQSPSALPHAQGGLGIGLALARGIVMLHGGTIEAHSEGEGKGSRFGVRLPRLPELARDPPIGKPTKAAPSAPRRVLVVDDLRDSADSLSLMLRSWGHDVRVAYDGHSALHESRTFLPEVVLLDLGMPEMDGFEVCRRLRALPWPSPPLIVAITGWGQPTDRDRTAAAGFDAHLVKPADPALLEEMLACLSAPATGTTLVSDVR